MHTCMDAAKEQHRPTGCELQNKNHTVGPVLHACPSNPVHRIHHPQHPSGRGIHASCHVVPQCTSCVCCLVIFLGSLCFEMMLKCIMCTQHKLFSVTNARDMYFSHILSTLTVNEFVAPAMSAPRFNHLTEFDSLPLAKVSAWSASPNIAVHQYGRLVRVRHSHC